MKKRKLMLLCALFAAVSASAWAQSNTVLDKILAEKTASFGDAAYLVLTAVGKVPDAASSAQAMETLKTQGLNPANAAPESSITMGAYSYMLMKALGIPGGVMYHLFPGPRYAGRELVYLGVVHGDAGPYRTISGQEAVQILGSALNYKEGR